MGQQSRVYLFAGSIAETMREFTLVPKRLEPIGPYRGKTHLVTRTKLRGDRGKEPGNRTTLNLRLGLQLSHNKNRAAVQQGYQKNPQVGGWEEINPFDPNTR